MSPRTSSTHRGFSSLSLRSPRAFTCTTLCRVPESVSVQEDSNRRLRMEQVICRGVIIGKHGDVVRKFGVVVRSGNLPYRTGEEIASQRGGAFRDLADVEPLAFFGGYDNDVLDNIEVGAVGAAGGKEVDLRKDLAQGFDHRAGNPASRAGDGPDDIRHYDPVRREFSLRHLEKLARGQMEGDSIGIVGVQ